MIQSPKVACNGLLPKLRVEGSADYSEKSVAEKFKSQHTLSTNQNMFFLKVCGKNISLITCLYLSFHAFEYNILHKIN